MSKLDKRAISIFVIAILTLSFVLPLVGVSAGLTAVVLDKSSGDKGDTVTVSGGVGQITSGAVVEVYWDTAIGDDALLLNSTTGKSDGSWECTFKVPDAVKGNHYVWAKDVSGPYYLSSAAFEVVSLIKLSPASGLPTDPVTLTGSGFSGSKDIRAYFGNLGSDSDTFAGTGAQKIFTLEYKPVILGSETVTLGSVAGESVALSGTQPGPLTGALAFPPIITGTISLACGVTVTDGSYSGSGTVTVTGDPALAGSGTVSFDAGEAVWTTGGTAVTIVTVTAPTVTADFTAGLYDAAGTVELVAPAASTGDDSTADTVVLTYGFATGTAYTVRITLADETGSYGLSDDGIPIGTGGPVVVGSYIVNIAGSIVLATGVISITATPSGGTVTIDSATAAYVGTNPEIDYTIAHTTGILTFDEAPGNGVAITVAYSYALTGTVDVTSGTPGTDSVGTFSTTFKVPELARLPYALWVYDEAGVFEDDTFTIGAGITITPEEGPSGVIVTIDGRGFERTTGETETITVKVDGISAFMKGKSTLTLASGVTTFSDDWVIPKTASEGEKDLVVTGTPSGASTPHVVTVTFEVDGLTSIKISPGFGTPGSLVEINGYNFTQIADTVVELDFGSGMTNFRSFETDSKGEFSGSFEVQALDFIDYALKAHDEYLLEDTETFRVGMMVVIISPRYGPTGDWVYLSGTGFTDNGAWNASMGGKLVAEGTASGSGLIATHFYVPSIDEGLYDVVVLDIDSEISLSDVFSVTETTYVELDPAEAPNLYNVTLEGYNFADIAGEVDFVLYNVTDDGTVDLDRDMDVYQTIGGYDYAAKTGGDGNFTAWWKVLDKDILSIGDYTINVTGNEELFAQASFSVVAARVDVAPRKALFDRGDTVQFNVKNDFDFTESYMKIWDPDDTLYWKTDTFGTWLKVGTLYTVPYYLQRSGMNPMILPQDATLGTWFYIFYEKGTTQLTNGTFTVGPSREAQVEERLTEIWASMEDMTTNIDSITEEIEDEIAALSGEMDDMVADVQDMVDDITADLADELAGVAADTEAAVGELEDSIGDIASAQNALQSELEDMSQDTAAAKDAAEDSQSTAQGLTTLVYGAIAASLIAALAAVVSLMQISKKIA